MKALGEVLKLSTQFLQDKKIEHPRRISERLLSYLLQCKRMDLYMRFDKPLVEEELLKLREWLKRVIAGEPLEYITGEVEFFGCVIKTDRRALIPRVETELLVERIAKNIHDQKVLWDVCTGSGCIGISVKKKFPSLEVVLSDISPDAITLAKENAKDVDVQILEGDLFTPFAGKKADIIVCNPPYVSSKDVLKLDISVRDFEPKAALDGGEEGLDFYKRLSLEVHDHLKSGGHLYLEIGFSQGKRVQEIFKSPLWKESELIQDLSGKDRFFFLEKQ